MIYYKQSLLSLYLLLGMTLYFSLSSSDRVASQVLVVGLIVTSLGVLLSLSQMRFKQEISVFFIVKTLIVLLMSYLLIEIQNPSWLHLELLQRHLPLLIMYLVLGLTCLLLVKEVTRKSPPKKNLKDHKSQIRWRKYYYFLQVFSYSLLGLFVFLPPRAEESQFFSYLQIGLFVTWLILLSYWSEKYLKNQISFWQLFGQASLVLLSYFFMDSVNHSLRYPELVLSKGFQVSSFIVLGSVVLLLMSANRKIVFRNSLVS